MSDVSVKVTQYKPAIDRLISFTLYEDTGEFKQTSVEKTFNGVKVTFNTPLMETPSTDKKVTLACPLSGPKPSISLSFKELPGMLCYSVELKVKYNNLKNIDIKKYNRMYIEAGYLNETMTIDSPIFYSYVDSPSPLGTCVFGGVAVGKVNQLFSVSKISITYHRGTLLTLGILTTVICQALGYTIDTPSGVVNEKGEIKKGMDPFFEKFWDMYWPSPSDKASFIDSVINGSTSIEVLTTLSSILTNYGKYLKDENNERLHIYVIITESKFCIGYWNEQKTPTKTSQQNEIVCLTNVKSASFTGPVLTVVAPWVPSLRPYSLFWMPPNFYSTQTLFNQMAENQLHKGKWDLYRAINIDVQFATNDNTNQMTIQALPLIDVSETENEDEGEDEDEVIENYVEVTIGESEEIQPFLCEVPDNNTDGYPWQNNLTALDSIDNIQLLKEGMSEGCIADFCYSHYKDEGRSFIVTTLFGGFQKVSLRYLWPIVLQLTYEKSLQKGFEYLSPSSLISSDNPEFLYPRGSVVVYPVFSSSLIFDDLCDWDSNGGIRQIYLNWISTCLNYNYTRESSVYETDIQAFELIYNGLMFMAGEGKYIQSTNNTVENV